MEEIDKDIDYWIGRLGAGEPRSNHEYWAEARLTKLRHARTRLLENKTATTADDREFARLAVEEARKSVAEEDGRVHPKVGAVVVKDGRVLAKAHRGEFTGCHAEYVALEKKLEDRSVSGATVYTTLEPCTTRNHPKIPCASRLIERKVARVVIGMLDPNPVISGKGQRALRKGRIVTELFPADLMDEVEELNREFTRLCEREASSPGLTVARAGEGGYEPETPIRNNATVSAGRLQVEAGATDHLERLRIESEFQKIKELWKRLAILRDAFWAIPKAGFAFVTQDKEKQHAYHVETSQKFIQSFSEARDLVMQEAITIPKDIADAAIDLLKVAQEEVMQAIQYPDPFEANAMALFNEKARRDFFDARSKNLKEFSTRADKLESMMRLYVQGRG